MDIESKIKEIEKNVIKTDFDKALMLIKEIGEEKNIEVVKNEVIAQLANLNELEKLKRMNQIEEPKYLTERSQLSTAILELKDQLVKYINNPDTIPKVDSETEKAVNPANLELLQTTTNDSFRKVLLALFAIFGGAALYFIITGAVFQTASTSAMLIATYGAKIFDDNNKMKMKKLLIDHQLKLQQKS